MSEVKLLCYSDNCVDDKLDIYLDQYLCIFVVPRLPKQFGVEVVYVHTPDAGNSD